MPAKGVLRVGIVGRRGQSFVAGLRSFPEVHLAAFCDANAETLQSIAEKHAIPERYLNFDEMLEHDLDVVVVGTPMHFHVPHAVAALNRGAHVLSEVTAAVSLAECRELVAAVERSGRTYMMAENYCYTKPNMIVREMVRAGLFGEVYYAEGAYLHDCGVIHYDALGNPTWRAIWQVGKRGCTYGTHSLGPVLQWLDDRVVSVTCRGSGVHTEPRNKLDDIVVMLCQTDRGHMIDVRLDMQSHRPHNMTHYVLQGTKGAYQSARRSGEPNLIWIEGRSSAANSWQSLDEYEAEFMPPLWRQFGEQATQAGHGGGDFMIVRDFISSVLAGTTPPIDVYRAMDFTAPGLISEESIEQGGVPLPVPDFRPVGSANVRR